MNDYITRLEHPAGSPTIADPRTAVASHAPAPPTSWAAIEPIFDVKRPTMLPNGSVMPPRK